MMRLLSLALLFLGLSAMAQDRTEIPTADGRSIKGYRMGACDYWSNINSNNGIYYACNTYPQRITVADGYDVANALDAAVKRIAELEARVAELEKKP